MVVPGSTPTAPMCLRIKFVAVVLLALMLGMSSSSQAQNVPANLTQPINGSVAYESIAAQRVLKALPVLPLAFEPNRGQGDRRGLFFSRSRNSQVMLEANGATIALSASRDSKAKSTKAPELITMQFVGANTAAKVTGIDKLPGVTSYFTGNKKDNWHTNIPTYAKVGFDNIYPGISLLYYGNNSHLENDFVLAPGADPKRIALRFYGAKSLHLDSEGNIIIEAASGSIRLQKPDVYQQEESGTRREVRSQYVLVKKSTVRIQIEGYDPRKTVVIDPVIDFLSYVGTTAGIYEPSIALDNSGNVYLAGQTQATSFPSAPAATIKAVGGPSADVFILKLAPDGSSVAYTAFIGGSNTEMLTGIAVDANNNAYVTGFTSSTDFPFTPNAQQTTLIGIEAAFVTRIDATAQNLLYSTYLGGASHGPSSSGAISVVNSREAFIAASTNAANFPTSPNAYQPTIVGGNGNAVVAQIDTGDISGPAQVLSAACSGGVTGTATVTTAGSTNGFVSNETVVVAGVSPGQNGTDFNGQVVLTAVTSVSVSYAVNCLGGADTSAGGGTVTGGLVYGSYLGGVGGSTGLAVAAPAGNAVYVTGTAGPGFPVTAGAAQTVFGGGGFDSYIAKFDPTQTTSSATLVYATYVGGNGTDQGQSITVDSSGGAYITGITSSTDTTGGLCNAGVDCFLQTANGGGSGDAFVTKVSPNGSNIVYSSYVGGAGLDWGLSIAVDSIGVAYIGGFTASGPNFFNTNAVDGTLRGSQDGFLAAIDPTGHFYRYATYIGGLGNGDSVNAIAIAPNGPATAVYMTGLGDVPNWTYPSLLAPMATATAYQPYEVGINPQAFVAKLTTLPASTTLSIAATPPSGCDPATMCVPPNVLGYETGFGTTTNYDYTITNTGGTPATDVVFNWPVPVNGSTAPYVSVGTVTPPSGGTCTVSAQGFGVVCNVPTLPPSSPVTVSIPATALPLAQNFTTVPIPINNIATAAAANAPLVTAPVNLNSVPLADIQITTHTLASDKTGAVFNVNYDTYVIYTITLTNKGPGDALDVQAKFQLATNSTAVTILSGCTGLATVATDTYTCSVGLIKSGNSATFVVQSQPPTLAACTASTPLNYQVLGTTTQGGAYIQYPMEPPSGVDTITQQRNATLTLLKTATLPPLNLKSYVDLDNPGINSSPVTYSITVGNSSSSLSHSGACLTLTDSLPSGVTAFKVTSVSTSDGSSVSSCSGVAPTCSWTPFDMAPGASATLTINGVFPNASPQDLPNTPSGHTGTNNTASLVSPGIINPPPPPSSYPFPIDRHTKLSLTALTHVNTNGQLGVAIVGPLNMTATINNSGPNDATNVQVSFAFPTGTNYTLVSAGGFQSCTPASGSLITCVYGQLNAHATASPSVVFTPDPNVVGHDYPDSQKSGNPQTITATVFSNTVLDDPAPKSQSDTPLIQRQADVSIGSITANATTSLTAGITLTTSIANGGVSDPINDSATNVIVTYTLPSAAWTLSGSAGYGSCSQTGASVTCFFGDIANLATAIPSVTVTPGNAALPDCTNASPYSISATIGSLAPTTKISSIVDYKPGNNTNSVAGTIQRNAGIGIGMTALANSGVFNPPMYTSANDPLYTVLLTNSGPDTATCLTMNFPLPNNLTLTPNTPSGGVVPGHAPICQVTAQTLVCSNSTPSDFWILSGGAITVGTASYFSDTPVFNSSSTTTYASQSALSSPGIVNPAVTSNGVSVNVVNSPIASPSNAVYGLPGGFPPFQPFVVSVQYPTASASGVTALSANTMGFLTPVSTPGPSGSYSYCTDLQDPKTCIANTYCSDPTSPNTCYKFTDAPSQYYQTVNTSNNGPTYTGNITACVNYLQHFDVGKEPRARTIAQLPNTSISDQTSTLSTTTQLICGTQFASDTPSLQLAVMEPINHSPDASTNGLLNIVQSTTSTSIQIKNPTAKNPSMSAVNDIDSNQPCVSSPTGCSDHIYHVYIALNGSGLSNVCKSGSSSLTLNYVVIDPQLQSGTLCAGQAYPVTATIPLGQSGIEMLAVDQVGLGVLSAATSGFTLPLPNLWPPQPSSPTATCKQSTDPGCVVFEAPGMLSRSNICYNYRQFPGLNATTADDECGISSDSQSLSTTGNAKSFVLNASASSATIAAGQQTSFQVSPNIPLTNGQYLVLTCSAPSGITCSLSPSQISSLANLSTVLIITQGTPVAQAAPKRTRSGWVFAVFALGGFPAFGIVLLPRRRLVSKKWTATILMILCVALLVSCGGGNFQAALPPSSPTSTPKGINTITVTATAYANGMPVPGVTPASVNFTLTVQ